MTHNSQSIENKKRARRNLHHEHSSLLGQDDGDRFIEF